MMLQTIWFCLFLVLPQLANASCGKYGYDKEGCNKQDHCYWMTSSHTCAYYSTCAPYTEKACRNAAKALGLSIGGGGYPFASKDYGQKGCYTYVSGAYSGMVFYGLGGHWDSLAGDIIPGRGLYRPRGWDCKTSTESSVGIADKDVAVGDLPYVTHYGGYFADKDVAVGDPYGIRYGRYYADKDVAVGDLPYVTHYGGYFADKDVAVGDLPYVTHYGGYFAANEVETETGHGWIWAQEDMGDVSILLLVVVICSVFGYGVGKWKLRKNNLDMSLAEHDANKIELSSYQTMQE